MPAIGYHFSAKVISRSAGQSAVAAAAYRIRSRLDDQRYGKTHDYSKRDGLEFVWQAAPNDAPTWAQDIGQAWNEVERVEKRINSTLAREYLVAFPCQLTAEQRAWMLKDFVREELTRKGLMATAAIHAPSQDGDERNYHAHIMFSDRPIDADGFVKHKDRSFADYESRVDTLEHAREKWAELGARHLEIAGYLVDAERWRHGHEKLAHQVTAAEARGDLTYAEALRDREPTQHLGVVATEIERDGRESHRGRENREVEDRNTQRLEIGKELQAIEWQIAALERVPEREFAEASREHTSPLVMTPEAVQESELLPSMPDIAATVERAADAGEHGIAKGAEIVTVLGEGLANAVEELIFGGASRKAPGGAEYVAPTVAASNSPEPAQDAVRTTSGEELAPDPQQLRQTMLEQLAALIRQNEQARQEREELYRDDDWERDRER